MKTPNLDKEIERLKFLERTNDLSEYGKELITEYKEIKKALNPSKCPSCKGLGYHQEGSFKEDCWTCEGTGNCWDNLH